MALAQTGIKALFWLKQSPSGATHLVSSRGARALALLALWSAATVAPAANWFFQPAAGVGTAYEENVDLVEDDPTDAGSYNLEAELRGGRLAERLQMVGSLRAFLQRYPGNERLDADNLSAAFSFAFLPTELDQLRLDLSYAIDTSRNSERTTTGNTSGNVPLHTIGLRTAWQRRLTERSVVDLDYQHREESFDDNLSDLVNSKQDDINFSYSYRLTEQLGLGGILGATYYDPDTDESYKGYNASLDMNYAFSQTLAGSIDVGWQRIDSETDLGAGTTSRTASGTVYGFNLSKIFERSSLSLSVSRSTVPTGSGEPVLQESVTLGYVYQFSPRLSVTIPIGVFRNEEVDFGNAAGSNDRRIYFTARPSLRWRITEDFLLTASYGYQHEHFEEAGTTADGNAVFVSLSYAWPTEIPGLSP